MKKLSKSADKLLFEIGRFVLSRPWISSILLLMAITLTLFSNGVFNFSPTSSQTNITFPLLIPELQHPLTLSLPIITSENTSSPSSSAGSAASSLPSIVATQSTENVLTEKNLEWQTVTVKKGDNLARIFKRQHLRQKDVQSIVDLGKPVRPLTHLQPGESIRLLVSSDRQLQQLIYSSDEKNGLTLTRSLKGFEIGKEASLIPILAKANLPRPAAANPSNTSNASQIVLNTPSEPNLPKKNIVLAEADGWHTLKIRPGDTLAKIFKQYKLSAQDLDMIAASKNAKILRNLKLEQEMRLLIDSNHKLQQLVYAVNDKKILTINPASKGFEILIQSGALPLENKILAVNKKPETIQVLSSVSEPKVPFPAEEKNLPASSLVYASGKINKSLYSDARKIGLSIKQANQLTQVFGLGTVAKNMHAGDQFSVLYEEGRKNHTGNIVAAQLTHQGKNYQVVRFTDPKGNSQFYTPAGESLQEGILRTPLRYSHISSHFTTRRFNPVLRFVRPHLGVDFAAPSGTPVKAAGHGSIALMSYRGGYGKTVMIKHGTQYSTLYGHLSRFPKGLHPGSTVEQGDVIGYVGSTGLSTGSHLHYEIHVNNVPKDPLKVALPGTPIPRAYRTRFLAQTKILLAQLNLSRRIKLAQGENTTTTKKS